MRISIRLILILKKSMYNKIEIHKTEYLEKYLLISNNCILYVGVIVKDIIDFLKEEFTIDVIVEKINKKHNIKLSYQEVDNVKTNIDKFLTRKEDTSLYKVLNFFNPSKVSTPTFLFKIFYAKFFYIILTTLIIINFFIYYDLPRTNENSNFSRIFILIITLIILFIHELGHCVSAKKFNVKVTEIGLGIYFIFPVFFVNLNESWKLKKEKRTIINLSGIYTQLIIGFFLALCLYFFKENEILLSVFKINFYIILINLNPFLKFDGYWVVSDLIEDNNLLKTSTDLIKNKFKTNKLSKYNSWLILYSILRVLFVLLLIFIVIKKTALIITKYFEQISLNFDEYVFILLIVFYVIRIIVKKQNLVKNEFTKRKK